MSRRNNSKASQNDSVILIETDDELQSKPASSSRKVKTETSKKEPTKRKKETLELSDVETKRVKTEIKCEDRKPLLPLPVKRSTRSLSNNLKASHNDSVVLIESDDDFQSKPTTSSRKVKTEAIKIEPSDKCKKEPLEMSKRVKKEIKSEECKPAWNDFEILQYEHGLDVTVSRNVVSLFEQDNTIPFIARYRQSHTGNMTAEVLRHVKETYDKIQALKARMQTVLKGISKAGMLDKDLKIAVTNARNSEMLEHLYAPYKTTGSKSLVENAKALGLEPPARLILDNISPVDLRSCGVDLDVAEKGVVNIMAHLMATHVDTLKFMNNIKKETTFYLETKQKIVRAKAGNLDGSIKGVKIKKETKASLNKNGNQESKFSLYFNFRKPIRYLRPHQVLAINRGETQNELSVKVDIPDYFKNKFFYFCNTKWKSKGVYECPDRFRLIDLAIKDCYDRIITPLVKRELRADLKSMAEKASMEVFSGNLKQILLAPPLKGRSILAIDPGFNHGCKLALISETGTVLHTSIIPLHSAKVKASEAVIRDIMLKNGCSLVAIGNGKGCRETEKCISDMISRNVFDGLDVNYTIVDEAGASVYSCSAEAKKEFPDMDPNLISAVSLARRIQDPLSELVKIEPKHLGVGMYQHDLPAKKLDEALRDIVSECVSFVGVDLNTASQCLLKYVAGLTDKRASEIVKYREENGPFGSREELKNVKGIGKHSFQQCAGFIKIGTATKTENPLDQTIIHPESYESATKIIKSLKLKPKDIGQESFITTVKQEMNTTVELFEVFSTTKEDVKLILESLSKPLDYDMRDDISNKPLFKKGLTSIYDLQVGHVLTGRVTNVTPFGCFVDVGVEKSGLLHTSNMQGADLQIGNSVEVEVINVEIDRRRIGLKLVRVI